MSTWAVADERTPLGRIRVGRRSWQKPGRPRRPGRSCLPQRLYGQAGNERQVGAQLQADGCRVSRDSHGRLPMPVMPPEGSLAQGGQRGCSSYQSLLFGLNRAPGRRLPLFLTTINVAFAAERRTYGLVLHCPFGQLFYRCPPPCPYLSRLTAERRNHGYFRTLWVTLPLRSGRLSAALEQRSRSVATTLTVLGGCMGGRAHGEPGPYHRRPHRAPTA